MSWSDEDEWDLSDSADDLESHETNSPSPTNATPKVSTKINDTDDWGWDDDGNDDDWLESTSQQIQSSGAKGLNTRSRKKIGQQRSGTGTSSSSASSNNNNTNKNTNKNTNNKNKNTSNTNNASKIFPNGRPSMDSGVGSSTSSSKGGSIKMLILFVVLMGSLGALHQQGYFNMMGEEKNAVNIVSESDHSAHHNEIIDRENGAAVRLTTSLRHDARTPMKPTFQSSHNGHDNYDDKEEENNNNDRQHLAERPSPLLPTYHPLPVDSLAATTPITPVAPGTATPESFAQQKKDSEVMERQKRDEVATTAVVPCSDLAFKNDAGCTCSDGAVAIHVNIGSRSDGYLCPEEDVSKEDVSKESTTRRESTGASEENVVAIEVEPTGDVAEAELTEDVAEEVMASEEVADESNVEKKNQVEQPEAEILANGGDTEGTKEETSIEKEIVAEHEKKNQLSEYEIAEAEIAEAEIAEAVAAEAEAATKLNDAETRRAEQSQEESLQREEEQPAQQEEPAQQDEPAQEVQLS